MCAMALSWVQSAIFCEQADKGVGCWVLCILNFGRNILGGEGVGFVGSGDYEWRCKQ